MRALIRGTVGFVAGALLAACTDPTCDAASIRASLETARTGEEVRIGACTVEGPFLVPAGVTLRGQGSTSVIASTSESAVVLTGGSSLLDVAIEVERGWGIEAHDATSLAIRRVTIDGPVTEDNAGSIAPDPSRSETGTHGIVITDSSAVVLEDVRARGFARFGVLLVRSDAEWTGGDANVNRGAGLMTVGGSLAITDVEIRATMSAGGSVPPYGAVFRGGAVVSSARLSIVESSGYGAIQDDATVTHDDFEGMNNTQPALWAQNSPSLTVSGTATRIEGNGLGGIVAVSVARIDITNAEIASTRTLTRIVGADAMQVGDGIHVDVATTSGLRISDVRLIDNERAGMLVSTDELTVSDGAIGTVMVSGSSLGVVAQTGTMVIPSGTWDANVVRDTTTSTNDASFVTPIDVVGAVAPMFFPIE